MVGGPSMLVGPRTKMQSFSLIWNNWKFNMNSSNKKWIKLMSKLKTYRIYLKTKMANSFRLRIHWKFKAWVWIDIRDKWILWRKRVWKKNKSTRKKWKRSLKTIVSLKHESRPFSESSRTWIQKVIRVVWQTILTLKKNWWGHRPRILQYQGIKSIQATFRVIIVILSFMAAIMMDPNIELTSLGSLM